MPFIPFASFFVCNYIDAYAIQSPVIMGILFVALVVAALKKELKIPLIALPWLALPLLLLVSINGKLEFATNDMLLCFSMLAGTILIFSQKELYNKWLFRNMLICANLHLAMQIFGVIMGNEKIATSTIFPLANEIMFFYMLVSFSAVFAFCKEKDFWKKYAAIIGSLAFISIVLGDPATIGKISGEDAVGIWLGLICGTLFSLTLFLWKKFNLPKIPILSLSALIFLTIMFAPIIAVNFPIFSPNSMEEAVSRLVNWQAAWNLIRENPFGIGFGAYGANIMQHWPTLEDAYAIYNGLVFTSAHNQYLQILTEIGWLGLLYYSALFAFPWFIAIYRYLKTGELHFLFIAGMLAAVLSVMEVAEAISMYAFIQIIHWGLLIYCVKAVLPILPEPCQKYLNLRFLYIIPLIPLIAYLFFDIGRQFYSMTFTAPIDRFIATTPENYLKNLDKALKIYPKNSSALWHTSYANFLADENEEALKAIDALEEISGHLRPINQLRIEVYLKMGNTEEACEIANFIFNHFADNWTLRLKEKLGPNSSCYAPNGFLITPLPLPSQKLLGVPVKTGMQPSLPLAQYVNTLCSSSA